MDYQAYLTRHAEWRTRHVGLVGDAASMVEGTIFWLTQELELVSNRYSNDLAIKKEERNAVSRTIFNKRKEFLTFYNSVKRAIDGEIKKYGADLGDYDIAIKASLHLDPSFNSEFFKYINQSVRGSFYGSEEGKAALKKLTSAVETWDDAEAAMSVLNNIVAHLDQDKREGLPVGESRKRDVFKQLKQGRQPTELYDFLFGFDYLQTKYDLKVDEKDLSELSPGERGGLLLVFYLMLDRRDIPLVIDQPEDNLDNKSVYEMLVTFLKKAKKRRQVIMVTHNPNLAVVADAEQIIHVTIDKKKGNDFTFSSGSIEDPEMNKQVVDILEGTLPAFDNRRLKYRRPRSPGS